MLVLSRKCGEQIVIPSCDLKVTVLSVQGKNVRLGITAPAATDVYREEVWQRIEWAVVDHIPVEEIEARRKLS